MTRRFFVSSLRAGLGTAATGVANGRPAFAPSVVFRQVLVDPAGEQRHRFAGPDLQAIGPGDVTGLPAAAIARQEPPPGTRDAAESNLATLDLTDALLPWLVSLPGMGERPWLALLVLRGDEGGLEPGSPLPTVRAPAAALPDPGDLAAWTHVEARLEDGDDLDAALEQESRAGTDRVVARLVCPRRLEPHRDWLACLVPATLAGVAAGLGRRPGPGEDGRPAWTTDREATLPVYHSWTFRTGGEGTFEEIARRLQPVAAADVAGLGSRTIDVRHPWPHADLLPAAPAELTLRLQGALRLPLTGVAEEAWSDPAAQAVFRGLLEEALDRPGRAARGPDRHIVGPPLYGAHHAGRRRTPSGGWMRELNLQARHRVAASLGTRYVQLEQEFLMERAWEQVGAVREANRLLAAAELATAAAERAQAKHLDGQDGVDLTLLTAAVHAEVRGVAAGRPQETLADTLHRSAAPDGVASTAFRRLTRRGGGLARRTARVSSGMAEGPAGQLAAEPVLAGGLAGRAAVPVAPVAALAALPGATAPSVAVDKAAGLGTRAMVGLLDGQVTLFRARTEFAGQVADTLQAATDSMGAAMEMTAGAVVTAPVAAATVRSLRRQLVQEVLLDLPRPEVGEPVPLAAVAERVRADLRPLPQQLGRIAGAVSGAAMDGRGPEGAAETGVTGERPLRPLMEHPRFAFPVAAELLSRWPEWTVPGITTFPENRCTLLETNPEFVEAALVGLNQEFNRELLWREYPTDQAGTPFARFWPGDLPDFGEIARWGDADRLGSHDPSAAGVGGDGSRVVLLVRADVLRRFPGTLLLAVRSENRRVPGTGGQWLTPQFTLPVDDRTGVFGFALSVRQARDEDWLFVLREPMRGTQLGFDLRTPNSPPLRTWADLTWDEVPQERSFAVPRKVGNRPPLPSQHQPDRDPQWRPVAADIAAIAFQRPFQLAFSPGAMLPR